MERKKIKEKKKKGSKKERKYKFYYFYIPLSAFIYSDRKARFKKKKGNCRENILRTVL